MKILVIGSGAREHAIVSALHRSKRKPDIYCYGSSVNPGIKSFTKDYCQGDICDVAAVLSRAKEWKISLAIIGPEAPLEKGLADALWNAAIATIGPKQALAQIETSKAFARELMDKYQIKGRPEYRVFHDTSGIESFLNELGEDGYVIKANGLMGGKGVKLAGEHLHSIADALVYCAEIISAGQSVVVEEKLLGQEFSLMCFSDGESLAPMPLVQDHKRAFAGDKGPNTGGMGSYSDANHCLPFLTEQDFKQALMINQQVIDALGKETDERYIGILYGGFIATAKGIYVIEFNARFGDPEALNILTILNSDFIDICQAMVTGDLSNTDIRFASKASVCKYAVPNGYPEQALSGECIDISAVKNKSQLYLAAVNESEKGIVTTGSRTAAYVGVADTLLIAEKLAEKEICAIAGPLFHRDDIGTDRLVQSRVEDMRRLRAS